MSKRNAKPDEAALAAPVCGLIMPISALEGCTEQHWLDVRDIIFDAIRNAGFEPNLVSNADDVGIIQKRIIHNLYSNPIVACDVSGKNPNVMFELGMRLAFDKPTIIVKDDKTSYSFDTSPIEHLEYPRDLRFNRIVEFKSALQEKIKGTHKKATEDPAYTTFLKNFGKFTVAKLETAEVPKDQFILEEITELRRQMQYLASRARPSQRSLFDSGERERIREHTMDSEQCERKLAEAVHLVRGLMVEHGVAKRHMASTRAILQKAKELGVLPDCFAEEHTACMRLLERVIHEDGGERSTSTNVAKPRA
jgi:hypothetical protein